MVTVVREDLPVRLASRLATELSLMHLRDTLRLTLGRLESSVVAQSLLRSALPHIVADDALVMPRDRPLVGSVSAVARSFSRSPETIRRHVHVLVRQGMFAMAPEGVLLDPSPAAGERALHFLRNTHDGLLWLIGELHGWGLLRVPARQAGRRAPLGAVMRTALDLRLVGFEAFRGPVNGWIPTALWNALNVVSVRHITASRALSRQFVRRSTPDSLRRPIGVRALAEMCGLPYATVWRHLVALEKEGRVAHDGSGYVVHTEQLLTEEMETRVALYVQDLLNRLERLLAEGLDPEAIPSLFMGPRPELVPIP